MQAEHSPLRGNGFIISPTHTQTISKPFTVSAPSRHAETVSNIKENISSALEEYRTFSKNRLRLLFRTLLSCAVALCSVIVFFSFFTFGTGIYCNGKQVAVSLCEKDFYTALSAAQSAAEESSVYTLDADFSTSPTLTLRTNITKPALLRDKLLLCSPFFASACTLYSGNTAIFSAENEQIAAEVVEEYISAYSMNGDAAPTSKLSFKSSVMPSESILTKEECAQLLSQSNHVSVVSVVTESSEKEVPFETKTEQDSNLYIGESVVVSEGKVGTVQISEETVYENGSEQSSRILSENIVIQPVAKVVRVGTKQKEVLKTGLHHPLKGVISSPFGSRWGRMHEGLDIAVPEGTVVAAAECGTVCYVNENAGGYGKFIRIDHGYGVKTAYAHLSKIEVSVGQQVAAGTRIGLSGNTGRSTGPHLHFEVINNDTPLDPTLYLPK